MRFYAVVVTWAFFHAFSDCCSVPFSCQYHYSAPVCSRQERLVPGVLADVRTAAFFIHQFTINSVSNIWPPCLAIRIVCHGQLETPIKFAVFSRVYVELLKASNCSYGATESPYSYRHDHWTNVSHAAVAWNNATLSRSTWRRLVRASGCRSATKQH